MLDTVIEISWFLLPAGAANTAPVLAAKIPVLNKFGIALDGGATFRGHRILGDHKTLRGLIAGLLFGLSTGYMQHLVFGNSWAQSMSLVSYDSAVFALLLGLLLGFGALFGDGLKSFVKRQLNILPGKSWPVFDQIDFVIGALVFGMFVTPISFTHAAAAIIIFGFGSFLVSAVGVFLRIKKSL